MSLNNRKNGKENNNENSAGNAKSSAGRNNRRNSGSLKARDKIVSKMTKDGLVEQNITTGENKRISNRDENFDLRSGIAETNVDVFTHDGFSDEKHDKSAKQAASETLSPSGTRLGGRISDNANKTSGKRKKLKLRRQADIPKSQDNQPPKNNTGDQITSEIQKPTVKLEKPEPQTAELQTIEPQTTKRLTAEPQTAPQQATEPQTTEHIPIKRRMVDVNPVTAAAASHKIVSDNNRDINVADIQSKNTESKFTHGRQKSKTLNNSRISNNRNSSSRKQVLNQRESNSPDGKANKQQKPINQNKGDIPVIIPENTSASKLNFTANDIPAAPVFDNSKQEPDNYPTSAYSVIDNDTSSAYSVIDDGTDVDSKITPSIPQVEVSAATDQRSSKGMLGKTARETSGRTATSPNSIRSKQVSHESSRSKLKQTEGAEQHEKSGETGTKESEPKSIASERAYCKSSRNKPKQTRLTERHEKSGESGMKESEQTVNNSRPDNPANNMPFSEIVDNDNKNAKTDKSNNPDNHDKITPNPKISKLEHRVDKMAKKLDTAKGKLPTKRKLGIERIFDEEAGKGKTKLTFREQVKSQSQHLKGPLPMRPVKFGANIAISNAHRKVFQVEHENVGTKAAHRTELVAEGVVRSALRRHKTSPYKKVAKLEGWHTQQSAKLAYKRTLEENPQLKKNPISRVWHKRKIKKGYAKAAREAKKAADKAQKAKTLTSKASQLLVTLVKKNPKLIVFLVLAFLIVNIISSLIGVIAGGGSGGIGAIFVSSYLSDEQEIESASLAYSEWEMDLMLEVLNVENNSTHQGYDEYRYNTGDIDHNPFELMAYLTAYNYTFTYAEIEAELRSLFEAQYRLTFTPSVETKYQEQETIVINSDGEPETITELIPYDWHVLTVTLTARNFTDVVYSCMSADQRQHYDLLMQTRGQRQMVGNPFDFGWLSYVTSGYGYRIHPISGSRDLHRGIDIGVPLGTEILAGFDGRITFAGTSGAYGNVVVIQADCTNAVANGLEAKYAHLNTIEVTNGQSVKIGDVIGTVGNTGQSTGAHLHLEVLRNGNYLNPAFFVDMGEVDFSNPSNPNFPSNNNPPSPPMNNDTWNALITEAERHLGKPYVFGSNGPNTFDCSSYVSFVLREAGVKDVGRQTAQGLFNLSSPISGSPQPGDLFFLTGTYSTSNYITHVGFFVGYDTAGRPVGIHAGGSMVQYVYLDTTYYQQHWVGYGRIS